MEEKIIKNSSIYHLLAKIDSISGLIGNTKIHRLRAPYVNLYTKLEHQNIFGSIKDRPAFYIMRKAIKSGLINQDTVVIESTSGNFGIALASICKAIGVRFIPVIDTNISKQKEDLLEMISYDIIKVQEKDETGGYLLNRIKTVKDFVSSHKNVYNPNQYENIDNYLSYYHTLGSEICEDFHKLDYVFISVSSCGTIIGLSNRLKEHYPEICIVGVDIEGSMIFDNIPKIRKISGLGASMRSSLLDIARIDKTVVLTQEEIINGAKELLHEQSLFLGASSGAAYMGAKKILMEEKNTDVVSLFISPDHGSGYMDSIFSSRWVKENILN